MKEQKTSKENTEKALKLRKRIKQKKPDFRRQESWRYIRIKENWRRPRGLDNKMRQKRKGWPPTPETGYRGPKQARGLHPSGYEEILVRNPDEIDNVNPETQAIRIAHTVGGRKRVTIIKRAKELGIHILNPREVEKEFAEEEMEELLETEESEAKPRET